MEFYIPELNKTIRANHRPIIIITSNNEKELPDAFLRCCVFHYINFPDESLMREIIHVHYPDLQDAILDACIKQFYLLRSIATLRKKPSTSELIDWIGVLLKAGLDENDLEKRIPFLGTLIKKEADLNYLKSYKAEIIGKSDLKED